MNANARGLPCRDLPEDGLRSVQHLGKLLVLWRNAGESGDDDVAAGQGCRRRQAASGRGPRNKLPRQATASAPPSRAPAAPPRVAPTKAVAAAKTTRRVSDVVTANRFRHRHVAKAGRRKTGAARPFGGDDDARMAAAMPDTKSPPPTLVRFRCTGGRAPAGGGRGAPRGEFAAPPRGPGGANGAGGSGMAAAAPVPTGSRWVNAATSDDRGNSGGRSRTGGEGGGFAGDTGGGRRPPSSRQGGDGWGNRDGFSGKPRGFAPRGAGAAGKAVVRPVAAKQPNSRARRRLG